MTIVRLSTVLTAFLIAQGTAHGQIALSFTDDFADGIGHPGVAFTTSEWDNGDVVDGQTWIIPFDDFGVRAAAKRDGGSIGGTGNNIAGRLRTLTPTGGTTNLALAAIDLTNSVDVGTLTLSDVGEGVGKSTLKVRLLDSAGTVGLEIVVNNDLSDNARFNAFQVNAGTFVVTGNELNWRTVAGANFVINFDTLTDTFDSLVTETFGVGMKTLGTTAFDNPIGRVARLELECDFFDGAEAEIGSEVSFGSISMTGTQLIEDISFLQVAADDTMAMEFDSQSDIVYRLDSTTDLVTSNNFTSTGAYTIGTGTNQVLFDPTGFSTNKAYRIVVNPPDIQPL